MATFHFRSSVVELDVDRAQLESIPSDAAATMSFSHEYVHYLQLLSSLAGARICGELFSLGAHGALVLGGHVPPAGGTLANASVEILPLLREQPTGAGFALTEIEDRARSIADDLTTLFEPRAYPYDGVACAWSVVEVQILYQGEMKPFMGYVTPSRTFRPFTPGLLAEGMARRADQWIRKYHKFDFDWPDTLDNREHYNGIRGLLSQPRIGRNVTPETLDQLTAALCHLALATRVPDQSMAIMLSQLDGEGISGNVSQILTTLRDVLSANDLLGARHFTAVFQRMLAPDSPILVMVDAERAPVLDYLRLIQRAASAVLDQPDFLASEDFCWSSVRTLIETYQLPAVSAAGERCYALWDIECGNPASFLLHEIDRVFFQVPQ
jgi:hypothetical protein